MRDYILIRSKRKTISLRIKDDLTLEVRAPMREPKSFIDKTVSDNEQWIEKHIKIKAERIKNHPPLNDIEINALKKAAADYIPQRVEYYSKIMNLKPTAIKITSAKKRFGSCNGKNSLCFSLYLMEYPKDAIDYVVVHELSHIKYHDHSKNFYSLVSSIMPDYKEREKLLKK